ncbi:MAG: copper chaperone PCu(A)C [Lysobacteraceae bacterium]
MMSRPPRLLATLALLLSAACAPAADHQEVGDLRILAPWSREIPPAAPVAAGFFGIRNLGDREDRLLSVESVAAERVEIHEVTHDGDVARMRRLDNGLAIPAGGFVELKPGAHHLMFIKPGDGFKAGQKIEATLRFEHAGEATVRFQVQDAGAEGAAMDHSAHHDHSHH